ncbi:MAG: polysaccharide biosynthesis C-terminal domain-containing protein [Flavobacteriales bacterium]|nr:polysaccharide biosynthesis C-terminal domain-containing protein [Flavobacteriales bacterium]
MRPPKGKFTTDLIWNAGAFGLSALFGVLVNLLIVQAYDAAALGVFNLVYAVHILLSQLAVGGTHLAVQAFVPRELAAGRRADAQVSASLILATATSFAVMGIAWLGQGLPGRWFSSDDVLRAFPLVVPGLLFFSWNKIMLSFHNGARRMRLFAVFQLLRFTLIFAGVLYLAALDAPAWRLPVTLFWTEAILTLVLLPITLRFWRPWNGSGLRLALRENFRFGNRALAGNLLLDVNTRVDVFMLGIFMSDAAVGLYSFAATVAEGVLQLPVLFRNNINPVLTRAWHKGGAALLGKVIRRNRKAFFRLLAPLVLLTIPLFPLALWVLGMREQPMTVWAVYAILALGIALSSGHQAFLMLFGQLGRPGTQTLFITGFFLSNVLLNLALIPLLGIHGAALATALSFLVMALLQRMLATRVLHITDL